MPVITAVYCRSMSVGGALIANTDPIGRWSHRGIVTEAGTVVEARMLHGVVETEWAAFAARYPDPGQRCLIEHQCADPASGIAWARAQVGKPYDYLAALGFAFHRDSWQRPDSWECAELAETALLHARTRERFRESPHRITPNMSWMTK